MTDRHHYIRFIAELLQSTTPIPTPPPRAVHGLDIGTGASAIYALLAARTHPTWHLHGTDTDAHSLSYAQRNVALNPDVASRIHLHQTSSDDPIIPLPQLGVPHLDFCVCNPPFYASVEEMNAAFRGDGKASAPSTICTGAESEMVCEGGDAGFVLRIVQESVGLKERVRWFSSMLGKWSSVTEVVHAVKKAGCSNWAVGVLKAGAKTRRWVVAWSWDDWRPENQVARGEVSAKEVLPFPAEFSIAVGGIDKTVVAERINKTLDDLDLRWMWRPDRMAGVGFAKENSWSRAARRKKKKLEMEKGDRMEDTSSDDDDIDDAALGFKITVKADEAEVEVRWLKGNDSILFESFCGMLKRAIWAPNA
jgi:23S rRNA (adenine1618-N6)-methyltransferase